MIRALLAIIPAENRRQANVFLAMTVLSVLLRAAGVVLLVPLVTELFGADPGRAWLWVGMLTIATVAGWIVDSACARMGFALGFALLRDVQHRVADRIAQVRLDWLTAEHTGVARRAVAATGPDLVGVVANLVTPLLSAALLPVAVALALLPLSWPLGVAALIGLPVVFGALAAGGRITKRADARAEAGNADLAERIIEFARTQTTLRASRRADPALSQAGAALKVQHGAILRLLALQLPGQLLFGLASQLALLLLAGTVAVLAIRGELTPAGAVAMIVVLVRYLEPFAVLGELSGALQPIRTTLTTIREVLEAPADPSGTAEALGHPGSSVEIEFREVSYAIGGHRILDGLSFTLPAGDTTAIVGLSGAGKTTVLELIAGLRRPTAGQVLIGGQDLATLTHAARTALVSAVFQDSFLFDGSVADNVRVGSPQATEDQVSQAISAARAAQVADRGQRVGEGGSALSGGERQRVSIARALLKPAPVLVVDEATSALDTENEAAISQALAGQAGQRTVVVVAHRLASISLADRVLFLQDGRIVQDGPLADLLATPGRFRDLWGDLEAGAHWQLTNS